MDLSSLDQFRASTLLTASVVDASEPQKVALEFIDFDPQQPRRRLDSDMLQALADTIALHGVLEPVSLRSHPQAAGRFIVNRGERRVRAAQLAGLLAIPAFVDERVDPYAQVIENEHREDLTLFDLATFVIEREAAGNSRVEIARRLGKPRSLITELASLKVALEPVQAACREGRITDSRSLYLLSRAGSAAASSVAELLDGGGTLSRTSIERLVSGSRVKPPESVGHCTSASATQRSAPRDDRRGAIERQPSLAVKLAGRRGRLVWGRTMSGNFGEVLFQDGGRETVRLSELRLVEWMEGGEP